jgi:hypothetical protein
MPRIKTALDALEWIANLPKDVRFAYLGNNPEDGGFVCILHVGRNPWWKGGGVKQIIVGKDEPGGMDAPTPLGAIQDAQYQLMYSR